MQDSIRKTRDLIEESLEVLRRSRDSWKELCNEAHGPSVAKRAASEVARLDASIANIENWLLKYPPE